MSDSDKRKAKAHERQAAIVIHKKNRVSSSQETLHKGTSCNAIHEWICDVVHQGLIIRYHLFISNKDMVLEIQEEQQKNQEEKKYEAGTGVGDKNAKGSESPTNENKQKDNKQNDNKQTARVIVLGVHLHCQGCVETVVKSLRGFDGVEVVEPNTKDNRVTVKEKNCDPIKITERVKRNL
ncbi:heavy metal-associated isoprenylated plant protein 8-like protein [Tanacetum coccineum]